MAAPRIGVLAYQGDVREHLAALAAVGADPVEVRRVEELDTVDGLVVPGGESTVIGKLADRYGLLAPLRERAAAGLPVLGTCAGMIFLAREVEGKVVAVRQGNLLATAFHPELSGEVRLHRWLVDLIAERSDKK